MIISSLESYATEHGIKEINLSAQVQALGFYTKLGYENLGDLHMDEHCPHVTMRKKIIRQITDYSGRPVVALNLFLRAHGST